MSLGMGRKCFLAFAFQKAIIYKRKEKYAYTHCKHIYGAYYICIITTGCVICRAYVVYMYIYDGMFSSSSLTNYMTDALAI